MRYFLAITLLFFLTSSTFAYPLFPGQEPSDFVRESEKVPFTLYEAQNSRVFEGYGSGRTPANTLTDYDRPRNGAPFSDFQQRTRDKRSFELYNKIQEKYEKEPRFRY